MGGGPALGRLVAGLAVGLLVAGCGGGGHHAAPPAPVSATTATVARVPVRLRRGIAGRLLQDNELAGFLVARVAVYTSAGALVSAEQLSPADARAESAMLSSAGFRQGAREELDHQGVAGLSLVERFGSSAGARQALRFDVARVRRQAATSDFASFPVSGIPGAIGFQLGGAGGSGSNVVFTAGDYLYVVGVEGAGAGPQDSLSAAAGRLYRRARA